MPLKSEKPTQNILFLNSDTEDYKFTHPLTKEQYLKLSPQLKNSPIVIDNGSCRVKAGFSCETSPRMSFPPAVVNANIKSKEVVFVGNDIKNHLPFSSSQVATPFVRNFVNDFSLQENTFDYIFDALLPSAKEIDRPVLVTEPFCNPTRPELTQLLFEYYQAPSLCFGVDFLFSNFYNSYNGCDSPKDVNAFLDNSFGAKGSKVIVSAGHDFTHVCPLVNGKLSPNEVLRIPIGGKTLPMHLNECLKVEYPQFSFHFSEKTAQEIISKRCYLSQDFQKELQSSSPQRLCVRFSDQRTDSDFCERLDSIFASDLNSDLLKEKFVVKKFRDLEIMRTILQILKCIHLRKEDLSLDYAAFLRLIDELGILSEKNFLQIIDLLEQKIKSLEQLYPNLTIQKTTHYDRVKTRERSRKQKQLSNNKVRLFSNLDEPLRENRSKYWDCSQLIVSEIMTDRNLLEVIADFRNLKRSLFEIELTSQLFKTPEIFFQPNLVGFTDVGGIGDCLNSIFTSSGDFKQIFVTGGSSQIKNFSGRVRAEAISVAPADSNLDVLCAEDAVFDSWKGARLFTQSEMFRNSLSTLEEYKEKGFERLFKEHLFSNKYPDMPMMDEEFEFEYDE